MCFDLAADAHNGSLPLATMVDLEATGSDPLLVCVPIHYLCVYRLARKISRLHWISLHHDLIGFSSDKRSKHSTTRPG